jgi:hypothetical protein
MSALISQSPLQLKRWEVQVLILLAQEPDHPEAREVFEEYEGKFSPHAKDIALRILEGGTGPGGASDPIAVSTEAFLRCGASRTAGH